jgi:hypothetical protein
LRPGRLFIRRKRNPHGPVDRVRVRDEMLDRRHDFGDTSLVVGAEQRQPRSGHDVVPRLRRERRIVGGTQDG